MTYAEDLALATTAILTMAYKHEMQYEGYEDPARDPAEMEAFAKDAADAVLAALDTEGLKSAILADFTKVMQTIEGKGSYQLGLELAEQLGLGAPEGPEPCLRHDVEDKGDYLVCRRCGQTRPKSVNTEDEARIRAGDALGFDR